MDYSPPGSCLWDSLSKNTGVGCHACLQEIFLTGIKPASPEACALQADSLQKIVMASCLSKNNVPHEYQSISPDTIIGRLETHSLNFISSSHSAPTCTMFLSSSPLCQKKRMHITNFQHDQYTISSSITFNFDSIIRWHDDHRGTGQGGSLSLQQAHKARPCTRVHSQHTGLPCRPQTACPPQERHMCYQI